MAVPCSAVRVNGASGSGPNACSSGRAGHADAVAGLVHLRPSAELSGCHRATPS